MNHHTAVLTGDCGTTHPTDEHAATSSSCRQQSPACTLPSALFAFIAVKQLEAMLCIVFLLQLDDPTELTPDNVSDVGARYGINFHKDQLEGLQKVYGQYLENIIPVADQHLE